METLIRLPKTKRRTLTGFVVSDKMDKTIVVVVDRRAGHPLYKKYVTISKKIKVHDEENKARVGDTVQVIESRPISKHKVWRLYTIIERAK